MTKKISRNTICPCGSQIKYKFCCIDKELRDRKIKISSNCNECGSELYADFTNDILNALSSAELPLKNFCKENNFYFFGIVTIGQAEELNKKLKKNILKKDEIINAYKANLKAESVLSLLDSSISELEFFKKRSEILRDSFEAHFNKKYTLSIPTLFTQLEGMLREIGNLSNNETFKSTIPIDIWEDRLLFTIKDNAQNFNNFINQLFAGSKSPEEFNRNPILHGFNINYYSEEHSLLLILSILEIRLFFWWINNTDNYKDNPKILKSLK